MMKLLRRKMQMAETRRELGLYPRKEERQTGEETNDTSAIFEERPRQQRRVIRIYCIRLAKLSELNLFIQLGVWFIRQNVLSYLD